MAPRSTDSFVLRRARGRIGVRRRFATGGLAATLAAATGWATDAAAHPYLVAGPPPETTGPAGTATQDPVTAGTTELEGQGQFGTAAPKPEDMGNTTEFNLSFGSLISTGNARQIAVTGSTNFLIRRGAHQGSAEAAGNYGQSAATVGDDLAPTVGNIQGRARYDYFVSRRWAVFGMATGRHDPFQGLELRLNIDPGAAFYIIPEANERLWVEAGYDFQFDLRSESAVFGRNDDGEILYDASGEPIVVAERTRESHAARLFGGYFNRINEAVAFNTGLEYLQSVQVARRWRLNWITGISTLIAKKFSLAVTFTARVDNDPIPRVRKVDTVTALNLVYRFL